MKHSSQATLVAALLLNLCLCLCAAAQPSEQRAAQQPGQRATYANPVIEGDYPDPSVIRVGDEYWAATTSGEWSPHFPILHSRDLVNWQVAGYVFTARPAWVKGDFWAPEIIHDGDRFFVYYTARRDDGAGRKGTLCVAVATATAPAGPYTDHGALVCQEAGSIDPDFARDEAGQPYLIWKEDGNDRNQPTPIWAQRLSPDGLKLEGKRREILRNNAAWERHVTEGSFILRHGDWFYHFYSGNACCGRGCNYALGVARSRKLLGTWEKNHANPILAANDAWQCPGHGSIVETPDGRTFILYHSYRRRPETFNVGREALLDEVKWDAATGWPTINEGHGPSSVREAPLGIAERDDAEFFDGFTSRQLNPEWQWPMFNEQSAQVEPTGGGYLTLAPLTGTLGAARNTSARSDAASRNASADALTGAVLARRMTSGSYVATTLLDTRGMTPTARAGLAVYSWREWAIGITVGGGKLFVWRREGRDQQTLAERAAPPTPQLYLRMTAESGELYRFAYSTNAREWTTLGEPVNGSYIEGARVALTAGNSSGGTTAGATWPGARFDWVRVTPTEAKKN